MSSTYIEFMRNAMEQKLTYKVADEELHRWLAARRPTDRGMLQKLMAGRRAKSERPTRLRDTDGSCLARQ